MMKNSILVAATISLFAVTILTTGNSYAQQVPGPKDLIIQLTDGKHYSYPFQTEDQGTKLLSWFVKTNPNIALAPLGQGTEAGTTMEEDPEAGFFKKLLKKAIPIAIDVATTVLAGGVTAAEGGGGALANTTDFETAANEAGLSDFKLSDILKPLGCVDMGDVLGIENICIKLKS